MHAHAASLARDFLDEPQPAAAGRNRIPAGSHLAVAA